MLAEKICGAAADEGRSLADVAALCRRVNENGRSMGMALTSCTVPHAGKPTFELGEQEMEIGIGIHGEPGRKRMALEPADRDRRPAARAPAGRRPDRLGIARDRLRQRHGGHPARRALHRLPAVAQVLEEAGLEIARSLVGPFITSLEMAGCSITLLRADDEMLALWDAPVDTPALRWGV